MNYQRYGYMDYMDPTDIFPKRKHVRHVPRYDTKRVQGRNEPCACGSGLKYKKCCGGVKK